MSQWIDFRALRAKLKFSDVLTHYGVTIKGKGDQHHGFCPLPNHGGKRNSQSFSANLAKGIFQCFGCGGKGNLLDFAVLMERRDPENGEDVAKVAAMLQEKFAPERKEPKREKATPPAAAPVPERAAKSNLPVVVNEPLDFTLKQLDPTHPYLAGRRFTPETIAHFGLGFCARGLLKDRIAIPLHDQQGRLVGYAGRVVDDALITDENPRYRLPGERERKGVIHRFEKSRFLYNGYRITEPQSDLIVVEGFPSIWWLWQSGLANAVGLMGWSCSKDQAKLIVASVKPDGRVWILPDGNEAGERCAETVLKQVSPHRFCRWVRLADGKQPTDYSPDELKRMLPF
ncbi:MAG: hypothetical protein A2849_02215 [Candidatus Taylorbacteria bacterium RIFCSPHIGHO2_01_FULL_51_15]|uniref:Zinc finger CHC2-type domain-containing protein n=1 Tax=Candidatus Taylorbacteria bacterium RIFCSPHIGHO2_01_FULL_51_15 TaxID=1802304 RepID=A0A1G2MD01_9BACT|nr:MAG: hypothetical protein A2849_02215 [Candidatus Taylorbacteria bacterium RIFCSPHIGHO2_01_FULL_51_15]